MAVVINTAMTADRRSPNSINFSRKFLLKLLANSGLIEFCCMEFTPVINDTFMIPNNKLENIKKGNICCLFELIET